MKHKKLLFSILVLFMLAPIYGQTVARWYTSMGDFEITMREDLTPITVANFATLTNSGYYDGLNFHRVIADFMIQDGDPTGTGMGGPGYTIVDEFNPEILFTEPGVLGMANTGAPNSGGSQYFITVVPTTWLNYAHTAFGNVSMGMDIVYDISNVAVDDNDHPVENVNIDSIRIMTPQFFGISPESDSLEVNIGDPMAFTMFSLETGLEYNWFIDDVQSDEDSDLFVQTFSENGIFNIKAIVSNGTYDYERNWLVNVTGTPNSNDNIEELTNILYQNFPNPFNPKTNISFAVDKQADVNISIFNVKGQKIKTLVNENLSAGNHSVQWHGSDSNGNKVSSGIYYYSLEINNKLTSIRKCILLK